MTEKALPRFATPSMARPLIGQHVMDAQALDQSHACALTKK